MNAAYAIQKATAISQAWQAQLGDWPSLHAVVFGVAQGTIETKGGDAWPGPDGLVGTVDDENNVGACTLRELNAAERAAVARAGIVPTVGAGHAERARQAQAAIVAAGLPIPSGVIHCDSSPKKGPYFVWFAAFRDDVPGDGHGQVKGWRYFVRALCGSPGHLKGAYRVLVDPAGTEDQHARAAYAQHYYTGFHDPDKTYTVGGREVSGAEANILAYASSLRSVTPALRQLLAGFDPSACPIYQMVPREVLQQGDDGEDVRDVQAYIGAPQDGVWGPKTQLFLVAFRALHGLPASPPVWDAACREAYFGSAPRADEIMARSQLALAGTWRTDVDADRQAAELADDLG